MPPPSPPPSSSSLPPPSPTRYYLKERAFHGTLVHDEEAEVGFSTNTSNFAMRLKCGRQIRRATDDKNILSHMHEILLDSCGDYMYTIWPVFFAEINFHSLSSAKI